MKTIRENKKYILTLCVSVLCLVIIVFSATYAYFTPFIKNEGKKMEFRAGKVKLNITENKINVGNLIPILDSTKETKAHRNEFTISNAEDSTLGSCYTLYLDVESIGENLKNKYFKYELLDSSGEIVKEGNFEGFNIETDSRIELLANQEINKTNTSNSYVLRFWFSYDSNEDQTALLQGEASTKTFSAKITASGVSGTCNEVTNPEPTIPEPANPENVDPETPNPETTNPEPTNPETNPETTN